MKKTLITMICLSTISSFAADDFLVQKGTEQVSAARQELNATLRGLGSTNPSDLVKKLTQIQRRLVAAERNLLDSLDADYPPIPPPPHNPKVIISAKCEIDDDVDFTPGQMSGGTLKGANVQAILADCEAVARANGSSAYSFGISDLKVVQKPGNFVQATCQIDDDVDFTADQFNVGELAGRDFGDIMTQCKLIAKSVYKANGSAGIKNPQIDLSQFPVTADCHLDDDVDFTENQFVFGKIGAHTVAEAVNQCSKLAKERFGSNGSSGLRNIVQN